jgi:hypothetical protein
MGAVVEPLSPELALVDEDLDRSARRELPEQPELLAAETRLERPQWLPGRGVTVLGGVLVALAIVISALLLALTRDDGTRATSTPTEGTGAAAPARSAPAALELRWKPVAGATLYNVILWKGGVRALDLWPKSATVRVPKQRLEPGTYQWFVYPLLRAGDGQRYGRVTARGTLKA